MKRLRTFGVLAVLILSMFASGQMTVTAPAATTPRRMPGTLFRDCRDCPEMVVVTAGNFTMGSSAAEKSWAASHGGNLASVADESPQHSVSLRSFALGKYDITRGEYAAFVREKGYPAGDGCGHDGAKWNKQALPKNSISNGNQAPNPGSADVRVRTACDSTLIISKEINWNAFALRAQCGRRRPRSQRPVAEFLGKAELALITSMFERHQTEILILPS